MTNLLTVLENMQAETQGVKQDVINYLLEMAQDAEDAEGLLDNIVTHGCESGMVNHLIYTKDCLRYYDIHKSEIIEMLESYGIEDVETREGIEQLHEMLPNLDDVETREADHLDQIEEQVAEEVEDLYADWEDMTEEEQEEAKEELRGEYLEETSAYDFNPLDKNYLAWAIFEYEASVLQDELEEIDTEEEEEPLTVGEAIDMIEEEQAEDVMAQQDDSVQVLYDLQALGYAGAIMDDFGVSVGITDVRAVTPVSTALNTEYGTITLFKSKRYFRETQQEVNKNYYLVDGHTIVETDYMFIIIKDGQVIDQINR